MSNPTTQLTTLRSDLGGSMEQFDLMADRMGFIGTKVLPVLEVQQQSDQFGTIPLEQLLKQRETTRSDTGRYNRGNWKFETKNYSTEEHGFEMPVDRREARIYGDFFEAELIAAELARDPVVRNLEDAIAAAIFNSTTWTGSSLTTAITNEWDDAANATPIDDVDAARQKVWDGTGLWPNALIMNRKVYHNLRKCTKIKDAIAASGAGDPNKLTDITPRMLAAVFDLPKIIIAGGAKNTAIEGQSASLSQQWSDEYVMVARGAETENIKEPCLGRVFHWGGDGSQIGAAIESYESQEVRGDVVRARNDRAIKVLYKECGHLLSNATTI